MKNIQNLTIDINKKPFQTITANVGEVASRFIRITILENNMPADLTGVTAYLYAKKADGAKVFNSVTVEDVKKGIVLAELTSQVLATPGFVKLNLLLTKDGAKLASKQIIVTVDESAIDEDAIQSTNEFNALTKALNNINNIDNKFEDFQNQIDNLILESGGDSNLEVVQARGDFDTLNGRLSNISDKAEKIFNTSVSNSFAIGKAECFDMERKTFNSNTNLWQKKTTRATTRGFVHMLPGDVISLKTYENHSVSFYSFVDGVFKDSLDWVNKDYIVKVEADYYILVKKNDNSVLSDADLLEIGNLITLINNNSLSNLIEDAGKIKSEHGSLYKEYKHSRELSTDSIEKIIGIEYSLTGEQKNIPICLGAFDNSFTNKFNWGSTNRCITPITYTIKPWDSIKLINYDKYQWNIVVQESNGDYKYKYDWQSKDYNLNGTHSDIGLVCYFGFRKLDNSDFTEEDINELRSLFVITNTHSDSVNSKLTRINTNMDSLTNDITNMYKDIKCSLYDAPLQLKYVNGGELQNSDSRCCLLEPIKLGVNQVIKLKDYSKFKWAMFGFNADGSGNGGTSWQSNDFVVTSTWADVDHVYIQLAYIDDKRITENDLKEFSKQLIIENYYDGELGNIKNDIFALMNGLSSAITVNEDNDIIIEPGNYYQKIMTTWDKSCTYVLLIQTDDLVGRYQSSICLREGVSGNRNMYRTNAKYMGNGLYMVSHPCVNDPITNNFEIFMDLRDKENRITISNLVLNKVIYGVQPINASSNGNGELILYVSPTGDDNNNGLSTSKPLATINKAIQLGATTVLCKRGDYYNQPAINFTSQYGKKLKIIPYESNNFSSSEPDRPLINLINGNKLESLIKSNSLLTQELQPNGHIKEVFIDKTKQPIDTNNTRSVGYYSTIWQLHEDSTLDTKLKPVLTLEECKAEKGTFFHDGTNVYINPFETEYTSFILPNKSTMITLNGYSELVLEDIVCQFSYNQNFVVNNNMNMTVRNCHSRYTMLSDGFCVDNSNCNFYNCTAFKSRNDGFNIHGYGVSNFYNCSGYYNYDDGISHHDGCTGIIDGGEWHHNGKGGISSPTHGAYNDIYNVECHNNGYGIYAVSSSDRRDCKGRVFNSILYDNINADIIVQMANIKLYNTKYTTKNVSGFNANLIEL